MSKEFLNTVLQHLNNMSLTDTEFRELLRKKINHVCVVIQGETYLPKNKIAEFEDLEIEESEHITLTTKKIEFFKKVKKDFDVYISNSDPDSIVIDLSGYDDPDTEEYRTVVELFGEETANYIVGNLVNLVLKM